MWNSQKKKIVRCVFCFSEFAIDTVWFLSMVSLMKKELGSTTLRRVMFNLSFLWRLSSNCLRKFDRLETDVVLYVFVPAYQSILDAVNIGYKHIDTVVIRLQHFSYP